MWRQNGMAAEIDRDKQNETKRKRHRETQKR